MEPQFFQIKTIPAALWGFPSERVIVAVHGAQSSKTDSPSASWQRRSRIARF